MFRRSPYLDSLPVLSLEPEQMSQYTLRRSNRDDHFCTSEVAGLCMALAGEDAAAQTLEAYLAVFTHHYLRAKNQQPVELEGAAHQRWREVMRDQGRCSASRQALAQTLTRLKPDCHDGRVAHPPAH